MTTPILEVSQETFYQGFNIVSEKYLIRKCPPYVHTSFVWIPAHIGIRESENVDKPLKAAPNSAIHFWSDLKPKVNAYIHTTWQENWDVEGANNLHQVPVPPNLGENLSKRVGAGRKWETVMCRLRVGKTWLTQSYL
ncbi:ribonuclease hi [Plakobranchus ocellatus]|uniref:Ribonuclease hi n=1 Tax=Plakobranchus ocellatus TaxID=259542 RepID=A0AAV4CHG3_9GAST|nr:ribonuclease hi [Plakobranchus ocellatus]